MSYCHWQFVLCACVTVTGMNVTVIWLINKAVWESEVCIFCDRFMTDSAADSVRERESAPAMWGGIGCGSVRLVQQGGWLTSVKISNGVLLFQVTQQKM